jgi:hypothetical protein
MLEKNYVIHSSFLASRALFEKVGLYNMQRFHQDYVLMKKMIKETPYFLLINEPLLAYDNRGRATVDVDVASLAPAHTAPRSVRSSAPILSLAVLFLILSFWRR